MSTVFAPEQTRAWTDRDLKALIGKYVEIAIPAAETRNGVYGEFTEGDAGICVDAGTWLASGEPAAFVEFRRGGRWQWGLDEGATIVASEPAEVAS